MFLTEPNGFMLLGATEALAFGLGISLLVFGYSALKANVSVSPALARTAHAPKIRRMISSLTFRTAVALAICAAGCTPRQVTIPPPDPTVHPAAILDIQFGAGPIRTVTALATDPNLPPEV